MATEPDRQAHKASGHISHVHQTSQKPAAREQPRMRQQEKYGQKSFARALRRAT